MERTGNAFVVYEIKRQVWDASDELSCMTTSRARGVPFRQHHLLQRHLVHAREHFWGL